MVIQLVLESLSSRVPKCPGGKGTKAAEILGIDCVSYWRILKNIETGE
jgi:hypothetical protein